MGIIIGIWLNGLAVDRWGYKKIMVTSLVALSGFIALPFAASSKGMIVAGMLLCGLPWGALNVIAPAYAVEVLPPAIRHYGPTYVNQCWVIGHLIGAGVQTGLLSNEGQWGWRIPFALQWMWPLPLAIGAILCPESPWWLVRRGRTADAVKSMRRLASGAVDHEEAVAFIEHTVRLERDLDFGATYSDMVRGVDRRRTEIGTVALSSQALVGFIVQGYQTYFFKQAGMPTSDSFKLTLGTYGIAFVGTALSMPLQDRFGRRTLWLAGMAWMVRHPMSLLMQALHDGARGYSGVCAPDKERDVGRGHRPHGLVWGVRLVRRAPRLCYRLRGGERATPVQDHRRRAGDAVHPHDRQYRRRTVCA